MRLRLFLLLAILSFCMHALFASHSSAENYDDNNKQNSVNPPIPPRRPAVFHASKSYVEELKKRALEQQNQQQQPSSSQEQQNSYIAEDVLQDIYGTSQQDNQIKDNKTVTTPLEEKKLSPTHIIENDILSIEINHERKARSVPPPIVEEANLLDENSLESNIKDANASDILRALDSKSIKQTREIKSEISYTATDSDQKKYMVIPQKKPKFISDDPSLIEPAAGNSSNSSNDDIGASKAISFYMQPEQIKLDENLSSFLQNHALTILQKDSDVDIDIYSYATKINGEEHSDIRISLARALEVRTFLINNRIDPSRLKLKPVTSYENNTSDDRIDLMFVKKH